MVPSWVKPVTIAAGLTAVVAALTWAGPSPDPRDVRVFAASSTRTALDAVIRAYRRRGGRVVAVYAASSTLAKQIDAGAPADLFLSAHPRWMDYLARRRRIVAESRRDLLRGRLVVIAAGRRRGAVGLLRPGTPLPAPLRSGPVAIGDPSHVPAGMYARDALRALGHWARLRRRAVHTANVRAALALVERGEASAGVVYESDARISDRVTVTHRIGALARPAIRYPVALVRGRASGAAQRFLAFLRSPEARRIFAQHGFDLP